MFNVLTAKHLLMKKLSFLQAERGYTLPVLLQLA